MNVDGRAYATDEDVAIRTSSDFAILTPSDQVVAWGNDGMFDADGWTLRSTSVDFLARGVQTGQILRLPFGPGMRSTGDHYAVDSVLHGAVVVRRKGQSIGQGQPPGASAAANAVEFIVTTLAPQLLAASQELDERFGIAPCDGVGFVGDDASRRQLRDATVLTVVHRQYRALMRTEDARQDVVMRKAEMYREELDDLLSRIVVRRKSVVGGVNGMSAGSRLSARLSR